ncbi:hypothetical protein [Yoonia sp. 208BN28-4]|uniref:hypothetical protein n=1 Tax=Yoonia sp. 208BN28-4 TaxID=3126505 RepID=UPI0030B1B945
MAKPKRLMTAVTTFSAALGIGFVMQYGDAVAARFISDDTPQISDAQAETLAALAPVQASAVAVPVDPDVPAIVGEAAAVIPIPEIREPVVLAAVEDIDAPILDVPQAIVQADPCEITMTATPAALAMVDVSVAAPCHADSKLVLHHQGMMFSALTDDAGQLDIQIPALSEVAVFVAAFEGDAGGVAQTTVPDIATVDRAVLQWQGDDGVQLHALEFGASYGDAGHISAGSQGDMAVFESGNGGYLVSLGDARLDNPLMAEVYTFPTEIAARGGDVLLNVETEITAANCGREVAAQSLQIMPGQPTEATDMTMIMPDCDAIGEFLVLKNMFEDLTLASR